MAAYGYLVMRINPDLGCVHRLVFSAGLVASLVDEGFLASALGRLVGALLAVLAIVVDLPMVLLTFLTAMAGATATVLGSMLLFNVVSLSDFTSAATTAVVGDDW